MNCLSAKGTATLQRARSLGPAIDAAVDEIDSNRDLPPSLFAALRENGTTWSKFSGLLKKQGIVINRKMLAELAVKHPQIFDKMVASVK